jgi:purine-binding chemotaxis protein CheW
MMGHPNCTTLANVLDDEASELSPEERTLRERARRLALEPGEAESPTGLAEAEVLICRLGDERYAIDLALLRAVQPAHGLTPIPCTPPFVAGMLNVRGIVVTVLDLARLLELPDGPPLEAAFALLTDCAQGSGQGQVGLLVHEVLGVRRLAYGDLDRSLSGNPAVRGIAGGEIVVLDLAALLADGRFEVHEEW